MRLATLSTRSMALACTALLASGQAFANDDAVVNGGFEDAGDPPSVFAAWTDFGNGSGNVSQVTFDIQDPFEGLFCAKVFGQFTGGENASGMFQDFDAAPGETWAVTVRGLHQAEDAIEGPSLALANIEWRDIDGNLIDFVANTVLDSSSPTDEWILNNAQGTAPEGTDFVRLSCLFVQFDLSPGAAFFDAVTFRKLDAADCFPDCNEDLELNVLDFVCYQGLFASGNMDADCNGDNMLNVLDFVCFQGEFAGGCP